MDNTEPKRGQIWSLRGVGWRCLGYDSEYCLRFRSVKRDAEGRYWYLQTEDWPVGMMLIEDR